jgi:hypothetical protein
MTAYTNGTAYGFTTSSTIEEIAQVITKALDEMPGVWEMGRMSDDQLDEELRERNPLLPGLLKWCLRTQYARIVSDNVDVKGLDEFLHHRSTSLHAYIRFITLGLDKRDCVE